MLYWTASNPTRSIDRLGPLRAASNPGPRSIDWINRSEIGKFKKNLQLTNYATLVSLSGLIFFLHAKLIDGGWIFVFLLQGNIWLEAVISIISSPSCCYTKFEGEGLNPLRACILLWSWPAMSVFKLSVPSDSNVHFLFQISDTTSNVFRRIQSSISEWAYELHRTALILFSWRSLNFFA